MQNSAAGPLRRSGFVTFITVVLVVAILRIAEDVIVPITLSVLLAFLLSPGVNRLARCGLPDTLAIGLTATLSFSLLAGILWTVGTQAVDVLEELPRYEQNIRSKISTLKSLSAPDSLSRTKGLVESLKKEVADSASAETNPAQSKGKTKPPIPVAIAEGEEKPLQIFRQVVTPVLGPLGTAGIVIIFVIAILFQRHDLRDRFINLISAGQMNTATQAVDDAARRVSRYLWMQLLVNATYGIPVGIGLYFIGVPGAVLWGLLATVLRFIPFLGPWIAAVLPLTVAAAIDPGWTKLLYAAGLFAALELISNNVVEVLVYGASTGISSFALLVAAVFWTWLWGTAGLFLSTPLTVCLLVMGKYVPGLKFFSILLGSEPALAPPTLFYQRMLSMNYDEMHRLATKFIAERSLTAFYDDVFIPALILAEEDRHSGSLAEVRQRFIFQAGRELIEDLTRDSDDSNPEPKPAGATRTTRPGILGIAVRDEADELVALMLQHVLRDRGLDIEVSPLTASPSERAKLPADRKIFTTVLSALPPSALVAARQACRTLKAENASVHVVVGVWSQEARAAELKPRFRNSEPDEIVTTLAAAANHLETRCHPPDDPSQATSEAPSPVAAERRSRPPALTSSPHEEYDRVVRNLARAFAVPKSLVKIIDTDRGFWSSMPWFPADADHVRDALRNFPFAVAAYDRPATLVVEDLRKDRRFAGHSILHDRGVSFFAGAPLYLADGPLVGILGVIDTKARVVSEEQRQILENCAAELIEIAKDGRSSPRPDPPTEDRFPLTGPLILAERFGNRT